MKENLKILELKNITKYFTNTRALYKVDFDLRAGEVHIILGENGAGKSTLIKILSGAYRQDEGNMLVKGEVIQNNNPLNAYKLGIFTIYQEFNLVPNLSVAENIFLGNELTFNWFIDKRNMFKKSKELLDKLDKSIDPEAIVSNLGVAQKQIVEISKALREGGGNILIFDEPTAALTDDERKRLFKIIEHLKEKGVGIIYISHRLEEIKMIGDRVTILRDGIKVDTLNIKDEFDEDNIIKLMTGKNLSQIIRKSYYERGEALIRIHNLDNVNIIGYSGEILSIFGLIGSGNIEFARKLSGILHYNQGEIYVKGMAQPLIKNSINAAIKAGINYLTPDRAAEGLIDHMSVSNNITISSLDLFSKNFFIDYIKEIDYCKKMVKKLNVKTPDLYTNASFLSGGNQQKVLIARTMLRKTNIFIFCEPTRGIDVGVKLEIYNLMDELVANGAFILLISSDLPEVMRISDRILVMHHHSIVKEYKKNEYDEEKILLNAFRGY